MFLYGYTDLKKFVCIPQTAKLDIRNLTKDFGIRMIDKLS